MGVRLKCSVKVSAFRTSIGVRLPKSTQCSAMALKSLLGEAMAAAATQRVSLFTSLFQPGGERRRIAKAHRTSTDVQRTKDKKLQALQV